MNNFAATTSSLRSGLNAVGLNSPSINPPRAENPRHVNGNRYRPTFSINVCCRPSRFEKHTRAHTRYVRTKTCRFTTRGVRSSCIVCGYYAILIAASTARVTSVSPVEHLWDSPSQLSQAGKPRRLSLPLPLFRDTALLSL